MATIPHTGPYVDAVLPQDVVHVGPGGDPSPWLDRDYLAARAADVDVVHLHTGDDSSADAALDTWTEAARRLGLPLVVTVHSLRQTAPGPQRDTALDTVLANAEVVLTLTPGAAAEIVTRFGRTPIVVSHPSLVVPDPELGAERGIVGLRLGPACSGASDPAALVRAALSGAVSGGGRLRVVVEAADELGLDESVRELAGQGELELVVHDGTDWPAQLQQLHVAVLPEPCGSHSSDLEICRDVGTRVVAPGCGWFADQWSEAVTYGTDGPDELDPVSLTGAVAAALARPMPRPADRVWRTEQLAAVRQVHADIYAQVAADRIWI